MVKLKTKIVLFFMTILLVTSSQSVLAQGQKDSSEEQIQSIDSDKLMEESIEEPSSQISQILIFRDYTQEVTKVIPDLFEREGDLTEENISKYVFCVPTAYESDVYVPIYISSPGILTYSLASRLAVDENSELDLEYNYDLYSDKEGKGFVVTINNQAVIKKAGTYYLKINQRAFSKKEESVIEGGFAFVSAKTTELKNHSPKVSALLDSKTAMYYKVIVRGNAKLTFSIDGDYSSKVRLCNSKKVAITDTAYISPHGDKAVYVVKKGTYYLKVLSNSDYIVAEVSKKKASNSGGKSRSKASKLKVNGRTRIVVAYSRDSTKKTYYYKFYNSKKQKIYLNIMSDISSGKMKIQFYDSHGSSYGSDYLDKGVENKHSYMPYSYNRFSSSKTLPKGTYYVKFTKTSKHTNGFIKVNVKNHK